jgi:integrase
MRNGCPQRAFIARFCLLRDIVDCIDLLQCYTGWIMASLYTRPNSPCWFLKRKGPDGTWIANSTGLRCESEIETAQAKVLCAEACLAETGKSETAFEGGWGWVDGWLDSRWSNKRSTVRNRNRWRHIEHWLTLAGLTNPSMIEFRHGSEFVQWREGRKARHRFCGRNTALQDAKLLGQVMGVAVQRGMAKANPIRRLGIARIPAAEKREILDEEITRCLEALKIEPEWMRLAFLIAQHTGCRINETSLVMKLVDFERGTITFPTPKGGRKRAFTRPLPRELEPILKPLAERKVSHEVPAHASRSFSRFFKRCQVHGVTFHHLRVSYVTRLHRAGVPLSAAMRLVNHSSEIVHEVYNRLSVDDVMPWKDVMLYPSTNAESPADAPTARPEERISPKPTAQPSCKKRTAKRQAP